jgi:hypothetical protein
MALATSVVARVSSLDEIIEQRRDLSAACGHALQAVDRAFQHKDGVELLNRLESERRDRGRLLVARLRGDVGKLEQLARMLAISPISSLSACSMILGTSRPAFPTKDDNTEENSLSTFCDARVKAIKS